MATTSKNMKLGSFATGGKLSGKIGPQTNVTPLSPDNEGAVTLAIPIIKTKDCPKQLPTYSAALNRSVEECLAAEELDNIQLELETLLSSVALRYRVLKLEYESLDKDEKNKDKHKSKHSLQLLGQAGDKQPASPATSVVNSGKRKRDEPSLVRKPKHTTLKQAKNLHTKNSPLAPHTDDSMEYVPGVHGGMTRDLQKPIPAKIDTPNKFWLSVEPYCMPLTNEDLRLLDDLLEQYNGPLVPPIPELGPHYSTVWAAEDLKDIQHGSNPNSNNRLKPHNNGATTNMLKKADSIVDECVTGPLTQRLVSALMEEQLLPNPADIVADNSNSSSENTHSSAPMNFRSISMLRNCIGIEKRVKKELIEQGILDISDFPNNDEDEIHSEIKRLVGELSTIAEYNSSALKRLHDAASEEIKRLEVKRKLDSIDQELLETYKRTLQNKAKRKPLSPEEQQEIYRLTAEQKTLSDQLERMQSNNFLYE